MLYSEAGILGIRIALSAKSKDFWAATSSGFIVGGALSAVLSIGDLPLYTAIGSVVGGMVAAYILYGKVGQAAAAGALAGILGTPFFLGVSYFFLIFGIIPISANNPPLSELQAEIITALLINLVAGAFGGTIGGAIRHRGAAIATPQPLPTPGAAVAQVRYCVQCGAQLLGGELICPHCNARQPQ